MIVRELVTRLGFNIDNKALGNFNRNINVLKTNLKESSRKLKNFGQSASIYLTLPLVAAGTAALKASNEFEQAAIAFETMLGSTSKAQQLLQEIQKLTLRTPFKFQDILKGSKQLLAYGIEGEKVVGTLERLGNIAAGVGMDKLPNLILALGQVKAATKLRGQEVRQFTEAGVGLYEVLSKVKNVSVKSIPDLISDGQVSFEDVEKALIALTSEGGKFNNLMLKQSKTLGGALSVLSDRLFFLARDFGDAVLPEAKKVVEIFTVFIDRLTKLDPRLKKFVFYGGFLLAILGPLAVVLGSIGLILSGLSLPILGFAALGAAVGAVALVVEDLWGGLNGKDSMLAIRNADDLRKSTEKYGKVLTQIIVWTQEVIKLFSGDDNKITTFWNESKKELVDFFNEVMQKFKELIDMIVAAPQKFGGKVVDFFDLRGKFDGSKVSTTIPGLGTTTPFGTVGGSTNNNNVTNNFTPKIDIRIENGNRDDVKNGVSDALKQWDRSMRNAKRDTEFAT